jgi:hypothetical protein
MSTFGSQLKAAVKGETDGEPKILTPRIIERNTREAGASGFSKETAGVIANLIADDSNSTRHSRFGASSRGDCLRRQLFGYLGHRQIIGPDLSAIFGDGHWRHLRWQAMGYEEGWFEEMEVEATMPEYFLKVSLDAVNWTEGWGFELKGTSNLAAVKKDGIPEKHKAQMTTMMLATGLRRFVYLAECKRTQAFHEIVYDWDPVKAKEVEGELVLLAQAAVDQKMPEIITECLGRSGPTYRSCPYKTICHEADEWPDTRVEIGAKP